MIFSFHYYLSVVQFISKLSTVIHSKTTFQCVLIQVLLLDTTIKKLYIHQKCPFPPKKKPTKKFAFVSLLFFNLKIIKCKQTFKTNKQKKPCQSFHILTKFSEIKVKFSKFNMSKHFSKAILGWFLVLFFFKPWNKN